MERYKEINNRDAEAYSVYGYDSMGVVLQGIENAIKANNNKLPTREQVRDAVRGIKDYQGVLTKVSFDDIGDNEYAKVFIFNFKEANYPPQLEGEVEN